MPPVDPCERSAQLKAAGTFGGFLCGSMLQLRAGTPRAGTPKFAEVRARADSLSVHTGSVSSGAIRTPRTTSPSRPADRQGGAGDPRGWNIETSEPGGLFTWKRTVSQRPPGAPSSGGSESVQSGMSNKRPFRGAGVLQVDWLHLWFIQLVLWPVPESVAPRAQYRTIWEEDGRGSFWEHNNPFARMI